MTEVEGYPGLIVHGPLRDAAPRSAAPREARCGGRGLRRERAHDLVYDLCRQAIGEDKPLIDLLAAHPEIGKHADRIALERMCDPANYLAQAGAMVDRVLARTAALHAS